MARNTAAPRGAALAGAALAPPRPRPRAPRAPRPARPARTAPIVPGAAEGALDLYFRDIGAYALITRDEEAALARRIRQGDAEALDALVRANLRFVVSVAKKYQHQGVSLPDLISEGNLGLIQAAHRFDETRGIKFISYAVWWVRQAILQALAEQGRLLRVPLGRAGAIHRIGRRATALWQQLGREATPAEIAAGLDESEAEVAKALAVSRAHLSLDAPTAAGENDRLLDYLPDDEAVAPDERVLQLALAEAVAQSLATLSAREARILRLYFGLDGGEPLTLERIGALLGVTRERVRQIKERAFARLRLASRARSLAGFLE